MKQESSLNSISHGKRIDFHTHILPNMDDGSSSVEMSMQMIQASLMQGVICVVLTPHFYASRDYPKHFFEKRKASLDILKSNSTYGTPLLIAGAEVQYFEGITAMRDLPQMRIEKSPGLMIEMPMSKWSNRMISDITELNGRGEYQVVLAHIDRYLHLQNLAAIRQLAACGVMMQVNADFFTGALTYRKALQILDEGLIHILGSDCHNMTTRPPNIADAYDFIERKRGGEAVNKIMNYGFRLLTSQQNKEPVSSDKEFVL